MQTMNTVAQDLNFKLQVTISEEAISRIRVAAAIMGVTQGQIVTDLVMEHLPPVPKQNK